MAADTVALSDAMVAGDVARVLHGAAEVVVEILPLRPDAPIHLPEWARPAGAEPVGELRAIAVERVERRSLPAP